MNKQMIFIINFLILTLSLNQIGKVYCMEELKKNSKPFFLCKQLKKISPNASQYDYEALAQNLNNNDLSVCECTHYLIEEKKEKALQALVAKKHLSPAKATLLKRLSKQLQGNELDKNNLLAIHFPSVLNKEIENEIFEHFLDHKPIRAYDSFTDFAHVHRNVADFSAISDEEAKKINKNDIPLKEYHLHIGYIFTIISKSARKATLLHEMQHLKNNHTSLALILSRLQNEESNEKIVTYQFNNSLRYQIPTSNHPFVTFLRANETEADRIPAACGSSHDAECFIDSINELAQLGIMNIHNNRKSDHPSHFKRYTWARRLYNLKVAEENLKKYNS